MPTLSLGSHSDRCHNQRHKTCGAEYRPNGQTATQFFLNSKTVDDRSKRIEKHVQKPPQNAATKADHHTPKPPGKVKQQDRQYRDTPTEGHQAADAPTHAAWSQNTSTVAVPYPSAFRPVPRQNQRLHYGH